MRLPSKIEEELRIVEGNLETIMRSAKFQMTGPVKYRALRSAIEDFLRKHGVYWGTVPPSKE